MTHHTSLRSSTCNTLAGPPTPARSALRGACALHVGRWGSSAARMAAATQARQSATLRPTSAPRQHAAATGSLEGKLSEDNWGIVCELASGGLFARMARVNCGALDGGQHCPYADPASGIERTGNVAECSHEKSCSSALVPGSDCSWQR